MTELEQYGATYGLEEDILTRIISGLDSVRSYEGWEGFKIPEYIWEYVNETDRDTLLLHLTNWYYVYRTTAEFTALSLSQDMHFALDYVYALYSFWWMKLPESEKFDINSAIISRFNSDFGVPESALNYSAYLILGGPENHITELEYQMNWLWFYCYPFGYEYGSYGEIEFDSSNPLYTYFIDYPNEAEESFFSLDIGIKAIWASPNIPELTSGYRLSDGSSIISGSMSYENYGVATGQLELFNEPEVGSTLTVVNNSGNVFTGVVTKVSYNLYNQHYIAKLADHVSAKNPNGNIEYTGGNIITVLTSIISEAGTSLVTSLSSDISIYSDGEETGIVKLFKSLCYALGASLRYNADGTYTLTDVSIPKVISDILVSGGATREILTDRYANSVVATIDTEFTENVEAGDDDIVDVYTVAGLIVTVTRRGEQVQTVITEDSTTGATKTETYTYNTNGYVTQHQVISEGSGYNAERLTITETYTITDENNYDVEITELHERYIIQCNFWGPGQECSNQWSPYSQTTTNAEIHLNGVSVIETIYKETDTDAATWTLEHPEDSSYVINYWSPIKTKTVATVFSMNDGPINQRVVIEEYKWIKTLKQDYVMGKPTAGDYIWIWQHTGTNTDDSFSLPRLTHNPAIYARSYHLSATAQDTNAITALGEKNYEVGLVGISDVATLQIAANNILSQRARVRQLSCSVPIDTSLQIGQSVAYGGKIYQLENITHDVVNFETRITATRVSNLSELAKAINLTASGFANSIYKVIKAEQKKSTNIARGKVISRVSNNRYLVQVQGDKEGKYRLAKSTRNLDEALAEERDVLLARPTGEGKQHEIISSIVETPIDTSTAVSEETPAEEPEDIIPTIDNFTIAPSYGVYPMTSILTWEITNFDNNTTDVSLDYGDGDSDDVLSVSSINHTWSEEGEYAVTLMVTYVDINEDPQSISETVTVKADSWGFLADDTDVDSGDTVNFVWTMPSPSGADERIELIWQDGEETVLTTGFGSDSHIFTFTDFDMMYYTPVLRYFPDYTTNPQDYTDVELLNGPIKVINQGYSGSTEVTRSIHESVVYKLETWNGEVITDLLNGGRQDSSENYGYDLSNDAIYWEGITSISGEIIKYSEIKVRATLEIEDVPESFAGIGLTTYCQKFYPEKDEELYFDLHRADNGDITSNVFIWEPIDPYENTSGLLSQGWRVTDSGGSTSHLSLYSSLDHQDGSGPNHWYSIESVTLTETSLEIVMDIYSPFVSEIETPMNLSDVETNENIWKLRVNSGNGGYAELKVINVRPISR